MTKDADKKRIAEFRKLRNELLKKLGAPPDAPPEKVKAMIEEMLKKKEERSKAARLNFLKNVRKRVLQNQRLPENTPPENVESLLKARKLMDKLNALAIDEDKRKK